LNRKSIIISVKPIFLEKIFSGEKKFEFRKKFPVLENGCVIYLYASSPVKKIIGYGVLNNILIDTPLNLWEKTYIFSGVSFDEYQKYFHEKTIGFAINFKEIVKFKNFLNLDQLGVKNAPQNYEYIKNEYQHIYI
jgi:predicted transcriptional regulator